MRLFRFILFLINLGLYAYFGQVINLVAALLMGTILILEDIYNTSPQFSEEELLRIEKAAKEHDKILKEIAEMENVKSVHSEDKDGKD